MSYLIEHLALYEIRKPIFLRIIYAIQDADLSSFHTNFSISSNKARVSFAWQQPNSSLILKPFRNVLFLHRSIDRSIDSICSIFSRLLEMCLRNYTVRLIDIIKREIVTNKRHTYEKQLNWMHWYSTLVVVAGALPSPVERFSYESIVSSFFFAAAAAATVAFVLLYLTLLTLNSPFGWTFYVNYENIWRVRSAQKWNWNADGRDLVNKMILLNILSFRATFNFNFCIAKKWVIHFGRIITIKTNIF